MNSVLAAALALIADETDRTEIDLRNRSIMAMVGNAVTNNIVEEGTTPILELQADTGVTESGGISAWADQSGNGNHFSQPTAGSRPQLQTVGGYKSTLPDEIDDFLEGPNFADNLAQFTVMIAVHDLSWGGILIGKVDIGVDGLDVTGWYIHSDGNGATYSMYLVNSPDSYARLSSISVTIPAILTAEKVSNSEIHLYINGVQRDGDDPSIGTVVTFTNSELVQIGVAGGVGGSDEFGYSPAQCHAYLIFDTILSSGDRLAQEQALATRYGITI